MRVSQGIGVLVRTSATAGHSFSFHFQCKANSVSEISIDHLAIPNGKGE